MKYVVGQGWVNKDTGHRRFKTSYIQIGRQNGKSLGNAVPSLYYGNFDDYQYPQIYAQNKGEDQYKKNPIPRISTTVSADLQSVPIKKFKFQEAHPN